jgi:hypothetical protein
MAPVVAPQIEASGLAWPHQKHDSEGQQHRLQSRCDQVFGASVDAPPTQDIQILNKGGWPQLLDTAQALLSFGSADSHHHKPTPLNPDRHSPNSVRIREVKA